MWIKTRPTFLASLGAAACLILAACPEPVDVAEERDTVDVLREGMPEVEEDPLDDLRREYMRAYNASDAPGVAELFTRDGVLISSDGQLSSGRPAIEASLQEVFGLGVPELRVISEEVRPLNGWAGDLGTYVLTLDGGETLSQTGRYVGLAREEDDRWRLVWLITTEESPMETERPSAEAGV